MNKVIASTHALTVAGLSSREAYVWHVLATHGSMNISELARATHLHRPAMYGLLPGLINNGLVKEVKGKRRVTYRATGTRALEAFRSARDKAFATHLKKLKKTEPVVADVSNDVVVYHGKNIRHVWEEVLAGSARGKVFYRYDGYAAGTPIRSYFPVEYYEAIEKKSTDRFVITNQALRQSPYKKRIECASRMLPASFDKFEQGVTQFIFGDMLALVDLTTETGYVIKNVALAKYHATLFRYLYQQLEV